MEVSKVEAARSGGKVGLAFRVLQRKAGRHVPLCRACLRKLPWSAHGSGSARAFRKLTGEIDQRSPVAPGISGSLLDTILHFCYNKILTRIKNYNFQYGPNMEPDMNT